MFNKTKQNDKNPLCSMERMDEMALCIKGNVSTTCALPGLGSGGRACEEECQGQGGICSQRWNLLGLMAFLAKSG